MDKIYTDKDIINYSVQYSYNTNKVNCTTNLTTKQYVNSQIENPSTKEILDKLDISKIETYLRNKKIDRIKNKIK